MHWEVLLERPTARVRRQGRFLVADLQTPHLVLSTSVKNGGQTTHLRHLVNHQSCEGAGHEARAHVIVEKGQDAYHDFVCAEISVPANDTALMGTAANMNYAATACERDEDVEVIAIVTAGVQTNAVCAGDPAGWRETRDGTIVKVPPVPAPAHALVGTINTLVLINRPVTPAALARVVVTMTEGKSAALQRLAVPSCYSQDLATGTGTDQFCIAAPIDVAHDASTDAAEGASGGRRLSPLTTASPHMKFGEIIGRAVRTATMEAIRWQNGLEPSYTRGLFHALGRYGVKEHTIFDDVAGLLEPADLELLRKNSKAAFYEPMAGAAAHALAAVLDRVRHATLPASVLSDAVLQQAATLAACLAAQPHRWPEFRVRLHATAQTLSSRREESRPGEPRPAEPRLDEQRRGEQSDAASRERTASIDPKAIVLAAIALGWSEKWRQG